MFYRYEIRNNGIEDILYIYLDMKYEFSRELINYSSDLGRRTRNFINTNKIDFKGNKVFLIVDGIIVKVLDISGIKPDIINDNKYSCDKYMVNIQLEDDSLCEITLREYLLSSLLFRYINNIHDEVLKSIAILYNTYVYKMMGENGFISSNNSFSYYKHSSLYKASISNYDTIINRLNKIIDDIDCTYISYNSNYILPFIHYSNSGKTLTNNNYPYLSSVKSLWDLASPYYVEINDFTFDQLNNKLNTNINSNSNISMLVKDSCKKIKFDNNIFTCEEIKKIFNLKSNDIYIIIYNEYIRFITKGWGNSYGLSIFSANEMANNGAKYNNILKYFFPKTDLYKYIKKLS